MKINELKPNDIIYNIWIHNNGTYNYAIYKVIRTTVNDTYNRISVVVNVLVSDWIERNVFNFVLFDVFSELNKFYIIRYGTTDYDDYYTVNEKLFTELLEKCESNKDILYEKKDEYYELYSSGLSEPDDS